MSTTITRTKATTLETKVLAINTLYAHSKKIIEKELSFLTPLIGKKVVKADGSFLAKYEHEKIDFKYKVNAYEFDFWADTNYYFTLSSGRLELNVRTCVSGGGYDKNGVNCNCQYEKQTFSLFSIDENGVITGLYPENRDFINTVYSVDTLIEQAKKAEEAAKIYESFVKNVPYLFREILRVKRLTN